MNLTGTIPNSINMMKFFNYFSLKDNNLHGTIPASIGNLSHLKSLSLSNNQITGTIPSNIGSLQLLETFDLDNNYLSGAIPYTLKNNTNLKHIILSNNNFNGTIPWNDFEELISLRTIPLSFQKLNSLIELKISYNNFNGPLNNLCSSNSTTHFIDISSNQFTGTIPNIIFQNQQLQSFSGLYNCLKGTLSNNICNAKNLVSFALDAGSSNNKCQKRIFPHTLFDFAYTLSNPIHGKIPECLYQLSNINFSHLSGNHFTGTIPSSFSEKLHDLVLSYNILTGTIPYSIQVHSWYNLDLSFNQLKGELTNDFKTINSTSIIILRINRLSGNIGLVTTFNVLYLIIVLRYKSLYVQLAEVALAIIKISSTSTNSSSYSSYSSYLSSINRRLVDSQSTLLSSSTTTQVEFDSSYYPEFQYSYQCSAILNKNSHVVEKSFLKHLFQILAPLGGLFYGIVVFDTYADDVGVKNAIWAPILLI
eukprot:gene15372-20723_t